MGTDPNELGAFLAGNDPAPAPDNGVAAPSQQAPEPKLGDVINDNAKLRAELEAMRLEMSAYRAQMQPQAPQVPVQDEQSLWYAWVKEATVDAQMPETLWLESPNEAFLRATAAVGRKFWRGVRDEAERTATRIGSAMRLDDKFETRYPDLYEHRMGRIAVGQAIEEKRNDPGWQHLMRNMDTIPQALEQIAEVAYKNLGVTRPSTRTQPPAPQPTRKGTGGEMGGGARGGIPGQPVEANTSELSDMVRFMRGESS